MIRGALPATRVLRLVAFILPAMALTPAYAAPPAEPSPAMVRSGSGERAPVNRRFPNLDAYLAHLEKGSHIDGAWYRQVRPGVYELQTGNLRRLDGAPRKRIFTREELEKKFGFSR